MTTPIDTEAEPGSGAREDGFLRRVLHRSPVTMFRMRPGDFAPTWASSNFERVTGHPRERFVGSPQFWRQAVHPDDLPELLTELRSLVESEGGYAEREFRFRVPDGPYRWFRGVTFYGSHPGEADYLYGYAGDITRQVEARRVAERAQEKWATVVDLAPTGIAISEVETGRYLTVNRATARILGYEPHELEERSAHELDAGVDPERRKELIAEVRREGGVHNRSLELRRRDGSIRQVRWSARLLRWEEREYLVQTVQDVTDEMRRREELRRSEERYRSLFEDAPDPIVITTEDGEFVRGNEAFHELTGYERAELEDLEASELYVDPEDRERLLRELEASGSVTDFELHLRTREGSRRILEFTSTYQPDRTGEDRLIRAIGRDVTEQRARDEALRRSERRYRHLFEHNVAGVFRSRPDGTLVECNRAFAEMFGYESPEELEGSDVGRLYGPDESRAEHMGRLREEGRLVNRELKLRRRDGTPIWVLENSFLTEDPETGEPVNEGTLVEITRQKRLEEDLRYRALHDPLTDLANRTLLEDRLEQAVARSERHGEPLAVLMVDINRFKHINDSLGHTAGDRVLEEVAGRLEERVRDEDTVGRWGGDEFAVVLPGVGLTPELRAVVERLQAALSRPIRVAGESLDVALTIGTVVRGDRDDDRSVRSDDPEELIRLADLALHRAKEPSGGSFHVFNPSRDHEAEPGRLAQEQEMHRGLEAGEFVPFFQPVVRLSDGEVVAAEVLARWQHPERGLLPPGEFIGLAESSGLIHRLGEAVCRAGCERAAPWFEDRNGFLLTVNLSAQQLADADLSSRLAETFDRAALDPERVVVEVTETAAMRTTSHLAELQELGVGVYIDDFGTGYSTFGYLRDHQVDGIKIDMDFVQRITEREADAALVETMVTLAEKMGLALVAEGIETGAQSRLLRAMGCRWGQGYRFARPMPAGEFGDWLEGR